MQSVLTAGGVEPSASYTNQLLTAIETITKLNTATASILGGIKSSAANWGVQVDPTTSTASVNTVDASTSTKGIVQLNDNINSDSTTQAATANAVRKAVEAAKPGIATYDTAGIIKSSSDDWGLSINPSTGVASVNTVYASADLEGIVRLSDEIDSSASYTAATSYAVRRAFNNGVFRAVCTTEGAEPAKTVDAPPGFTLKPNTLIAVRFTNWNTAANPTLEVGSTGAYPIIYDNWNTPKGGYYQTWQPEEVVLFCFYYSKWRMLKSNPITLSNSGILYIEY